ncbi:uncharacterized protein TNCV_4951341 [Trichonephila clavipes]|nr:uncharacterized protein TNCV_4951341 [Trichonephila clavipes]
MRSTTSVCRTYCIQRSHICTTVDWFRPTRLPNFLKDNPQPRLSAPSVERLANHRLHHARGEACDWLDAQRSSLTALVLMQLNSSSERTMKCAKIKDEVETLAYQLNEEAERTERPIRRLSKVMYGSTCADMQVDVMGECLSSIKHVVGVRSVFLAKRLHAV